jgi:hypothetical protein
MPEVLSPQHEFESESFDGTKHELESSSEVFTNPEIADAEELAVELVKQLKENIDRGAYDTLISDEVGGRVPTLLIREIIRQVRPGIKMQTYFVNGGQYLYNEERRSVLKKHLESILVNTKKALLVTQYVSSGGSIRVLASMVRGAGVENLDCATLFVGRTHDTIGNVFGELVNNVYYGNKELKDSQGLMLEDEHEHLSGVAKDYSLPHPIAERPIVLESGHRNVTREWEPEFYPPTSEGMGRYQAQINSVRADIKLLAKKVIKQVWGK